MSEVALTKEKVNNHVFKHTMYSKKGKFLKCHIKSGLVIGYSVGELLTEEIDKAIKYFNR